MFALVFAAHGIVGETDSDVSLFKTHDEAIAAMEWHLDSYIQENHADDDDFNAYNDAYLGEDHANCDDAEWHIYETDFE